MQVVYIAIILFACSKIGAIFLVIPPDAIYSEILISTFRHLNGDMCIFELQKGILSALNTKGSPKSLKAI